MFHFPAFPPHTLYIQVRVTHHNVGQVSPFGHPRITARLPTPRGLSQATTSFFGSQCQGIHRTPLQNSQQKNSSIHTNQRCSRPLYSYQTTHPHHTHQPKAGAHSGAARAADPKPQQHAVSHSTTTCSECTLKQHTTRYPIGRNIATTPPAQTKSL